MVQKAGLIAGRPLRADVCFEHDPVSHKALSHYQSVNQTPGFHFYCVGNTRYSFFTKRLKHSTS
jgi:hypothetical protein